MKLNEKQVKEIQEKVDEYIEPKDEEGNSKKKNLANSHRELLEFYKQGFFLDMTDEERFVAKQYFKSKLPYKEWRDRISKVPGMLSKEMEDFQELYDKTYYRQRKTPRGEGV